jgi:hypothetical protein
LTKQRKKSTRNTKKKKLFSFLFSLLIIKNDRLYIGSRVTKLLMKLIVSSNSSNDVKNTKKSSELGKRF